MKKKLGKASQRLLPYCDASMRVVNNVMCESAQIVCNVYKRLDPSIDESVVMDLMVSVGGSWMTRGHSSLYGIGCDGPHGEC